MGPHSVSDRGTNTQTNCGASGHIFFTHFTGVISVWQTCTWIQSARTPLQDNPPTPSANILKIQIYNKGLFVAMWVRKLHANKFDDKNIIRTFGQRENICDFGKTTVRSSLIDVDL